MLLVIDNYDSFTYNLVQYLGELGEDVRVYRNDKISLDEITALHPSRIVISPGPCTPNEAGISVRTIYRGLPDPFEATRYHSLIVNRTNLPACFDISAETAEGEIMGLRHRTLG